MLLSATFHGCKHAAVHLIQEVRLSVSLPSSFVNLAVLSPTLDKSIHSASQAFVELVHVLHMAIGVLQFHFINRI